MKAGGNLLDKPKILLFLVSQLLRERSVYLVDDLIIPYVLLFSTFWLSLRSSFSINKIKSIGTQDTADAGTLATICWWNSTGPP